VISRCNALLVGILERGIARGEFRAVDTVNANLVIVAPLVMLMMWKHSFHSCRLEPISAKDYLDCFLDLLITGLQAKAPEANGPQALNEPPSNHH